MGIKTGSRQHWLASKAFIAASVMSSVILYGQVIGQGRLADAGDPDRAAVAADDSARGAMRQVADYLARRYRVASDVLDGLVDAAYLTGHQLGLDPLLILSVIAVESRFNPIAQSEYGAKGLMQVIPEQHQARMKSFGIVSVLEPGSNILVGSSILRDCIRRAGGVRGGLQLYAGAYGDPDASYAQKVMAERARIENAMRQTRQQAAALARGATPAI